MIDELRQAGLPLEPEWFAPHFEFRFPLLRAASTIAASSSSSGRRSSPGTSWARRPAAGGDGALRRFVGRAAPGEGPGDDRQPARGHLQRPPGPAAPDRDERRVRRGRPLPRLAAAVVPAPDHPGARARWSSTWSTPGWAARSAAAPTTSRTPAAGRTTPSRSTPTRPRAGGIARFVPFGHTPGPDRACRPRSGNPEFAVHPGPAPAAGRAVPPGGSRGCAPPAARRACGMMVDAIMRTGRIDHRARGSSGPHANRDPTGRRQTSMRRGRPSPAAGAWTVRRARRARSTRWSPPTAASARTGGRSSTRSRRSAWPSSGSAGRRPST